MRALISVFIIAATPLDAQPVEVDLELVLAADFSRSMDYGDLVTQRLGYAEALTSPDVIEAIEGGMIGRIAVTYVEWADAKRQRVLVDWTLIDDLEDAKSIAARLVRETGGTVRETSISSGLVFAAGRFADSPFTSFRQVIDISGDGPNNDGIPVTIARDAVIALGITINGLPLMFDTSDPVWHLSDLDAYYRECVIGGTGAFLLPVIGWEQFPDAIRRKLILEIAGVSPQSTIDGPILAAAYDCLIGEKIRDRRREKRN